MTIKTNPELDLEEFGDKVYSGPFWCTTDYNIINGIYNFKCKLEFEHKGNTEQRWVDFSKELDRKDMSFDLVEYKFKKSISYFDGKNIENHEKEFGTWFPTDEEKLSWGKDYYKGHHELRAVIGNQEQVMEVEV